jgi:hypothetical protein
MTDDIDKDNPADEWTTSEKEAIGPVSEMALTWQQTYMADIIATAWIKHTGSPFKISQETGLSRTTVWRWLSEPVVQVAIKDKLDLAIKNTGTSVEWILGCLRDIVDRCMQTQAVLDKEGKPTGMFMFNARDAKGALELLGKYHKMFVDRQEVTGKDGNPIEHSVVAVIPEYDPNDPESIRRAHETVFGLPAAIREKQRSQEDGD